MPSNMRKTNYCDKCHKLYEVPFFLEDLNIPWCPPCWKKYLSNNHKVEYLYDLR